MSQVTAKAMALSGILAGGFADDVYINHITGVIQRLLERIDGQQQRPEGHRGETQEQSPPNQGGCSQGGISDRLSNFNAWGNRIKESD